MSFTFFRNFTTLPYTVCILLISSCVSSNNSLPKNFVYLTDIDPTIIESVRYYGNDNFLGRPARGYNINRIIATKLAAQRLQLVNAELKKQALGLVVYDGYRPQTSVDNFVEWGKDLNDQSMKEYYYPTNSKSQVFEQGYIAEKSGHSRGSTFDLTIIEKGKKISHIKYLKRLLTNNEEITFLDDNTLDMGSSFDLFHEASHHDTSLIDSKHTRNREILRKVMNKYGFKEYKKEWWHYTLDSEPYPNTYFDFVARSK